MTVAAAFPSARPPLGALIDTLQVIALRSPKDLQALQIWAEMIAARIQRDDLTAIRDASKGSW